MNTKEFVEKAKKIHNNKYDYSISKYINSKIKIKIICPTHGEFEQCYSSHLKGFGCKQCQIENYKTKYDDNLINKLNKIHNNKYNYVKHIDHPKKIIIICPEHGEFEQLLRGHLSGKGCKKCATNSMKLNFDEFVKRAKKIHNNKYKYIKPNIFNKSSKITIICPNHGEFKQSISNHLKSYGCKKCGIESYSYSTDEFIKKAIDIHDNKYNYDKTKYINSYTKITITCKKHGDFDQNPSQHLCGYGCKQCAHDNNRLSIDDFILRSSEIHKNKYSYELVDFNNYYDNIKIICPIHGIYEQSVSNHLYGHGCNLCVAPISSGHQEIIDFINKTNVDIDINNRTIIKPNELDIFIPDKMVAIEYNGDYWHSHNHPENQKQIYYHYNKFKTCLDKNIRLIQINEYYWINEGTRKIIESRINNILGFTESRIYARKCNSRIVPREEEIKFINNNHIQQHKNSTIAYGLYYNDELVSCMTFNRYKNFWEIMRFANKLDHIIIGGASKLFKKFIVDHKPSMVLSYSDLRYSNGNLYRKLGFELDGITKPGYCYINKHKIYSRQQFQKHKLKNKLEIFDPNLTEAANMFNNGFRRLWDAGNYRFIWRNK